MANFVQTSSEPSLTSLVKGIVDDTQELLKQQLAFFKLEVRDDLHKTKVAVSALITGLVVGALGGIFLCLMLVHLLSRIWPELPLWGSYAIVGGFLAALGGFLFHRGKKRFASFNPLPDETVATLKENLQWTKNRK